MTTTVAIDIHDWLANEGMMWRAQYSFDIPAQTHHYIGFTVADSPAWLSRRSFSTEGTDTSFSLYIDTQYAGGSDIALVNRNHYYKTAMYKSALTQIKGDVSASPQIENQVAYLRLKTAGQLEITTGQDSGFIIKLKANADYVVDIYNANNATRISNFSADIARVDFLA